VAARGGLGGVDRSADGTCVLCPVGSFPQSDEMPAMLPRPPIEELEHERYISALETADREQREAAQAGSAGPRDKIAALRKQLAAFKSLEPVLHGAPDRPANVDRSGREGAAAASSATTHDARWTRSITSSLPTRVMPALSMLRPEPRASPPSRRRSTELTHDTECATDGQ